MPYFPACFPRKQVFEDWVRGRRRSPWLLAELDAWENRWFPIASASLRARFPEAHEWLFLNLSQTEGPAVVISVSTFLDRLARMATEASLGARGAEAVELLTQRGVHLPRTVRSVG